MHITTNLNALKITQELKSNENDLGKVINRISTGKNLDHSADNLAHILTSSKSLSDLKALNQVTENANDGVGLLQTAEGGLKEIQGILYRLKEISVQATGETYSPSDRSAINAETKLLLNQIDSIISMTEWNSKKLLGGAISNEKITTSINSPRSNQLDITLADNSVSGLFDYTAPTFTNGDFSTGTENWTVNNNQLKLGQNGIAGETTVAGFAAAIDQSPIAATGGQSSRGDDFAPSSANYNSQLIDGSLRLYSDMTTSAGGDIVHGPYIVSNEAVYIESGRSVNFDWRAQGGSDAYDVYAYLLNTDTGATIELLNETGSGTADSGWNTETLEVNVTGNYKFVFTSGTFDETFGRAAGASLYLDNIIVTGASTTLSDYGQVLSNLTTDSANTSITKIDTALEKVITQRSYIGAKLSRLESVINNLSIHSTNVNANFSKLENADYATESSALAKAQILREAGMAALTFSKATPKTVLDLLKP